MSAQTVTSGIAMAARMEAAATMALASTVEEAWRALRRPTRPTSASSGVGVGLMSHQTSTPPRNAATQSGLKLPRSRYMGTPLPDQEHQRDCERAAEDGRRPRAQLMEPRGGLRLGLRLGLAAQLDGELIQHDLLGLEQAVDLDAAAGHLRL
jgi:hypothetical protein